jgi:hypothetical protein
MSVSFEFPDRWNGLGPAYGELRRGSVVADRMKLGVGSDGRIVYTGLNSESIQRSIQSATILTYMRKERRQTSVC